MLRYAVLSQSYAKLLKRSELQLSCKVTAWVAAELRWVAAELQAATQAQLSATQAQLKCNSEPSELHSELQLSCSWVAAELRWVAAELHQKHPGFYIFYKVWVAAELRWVADRWALKPDSAVNRKAQWKEKEA